jgi:signal transduction histidine kinase
MGNRINPLYDVVLILAIDSPWEKAEGWGCRAEGGRIGVPPLMAWAQNPQSDRRCSMTTSDNERLLALLQKALGHELPNRLLAIQGLAQLLTIEEAERLSADGKDYIARLAAAAQRAHALVKTLADIVHVGRPEPTAQPTSVAEVVREAVAEAKQLFPCTAIEYHLPETGPLLRVPRRDLRQVATHLLRNTCRAGAPDRELRVEVGAHDTPKGVEFWVTDTGRGLTTEEQERLFEPFATHDEAGLGLILVRDIVESWGGQLHVQSAPGQGSKFTVEVIGHWS